MAETVPRREYSRLTIALKNMGVLNGLEKLAKENPAAVVTALLGREDPTAEDYMFALQVAMDMEEPVLNELFRNMGTYTFGKYFAEARTGKDTEGLRDLVALMENLKDGAYKLGNEEYRSTEKARPRGR